MFIKNKEHVACSAARQEKKMAGNGPGAYDKVVSKADDVADRILRHSKHYLPHIARLCLVATFLEDGLRMWFQWREQKDYVSLTWRCGEFLAHLFVLFNMVGQIAGCAMVLVRKYVSAAVLMLFGVILLQVRGCTIGTGQGSADVAARARSTAH